MFEPDLFSYEPPSGYIGAAGYSEPTTSKAAAERVDEMPITAWLIENLPDFVRRNPCLTAKEISSKLGWKLSGDVDKDKDLVKPRLSFLKKAKQLRWSKDERGKYLTRKGEHLWEAV